MRHLHVLRGVCLPNLVDHNLNIITPNIRPGVRQELEKPEEVVSRQAVWLNLGCEILPVVTDSPTSDYFIISAARCPIKPGMPRRPERSRILGMLNASINEFKLLFCPNYSFTPGGPR